MTLAYLKLKILEKVKQRRQGIVLKQNNIVNISFYYEGYK